MRHKKVLYFVLFLYAILLSLSSCTTIPKTIIIAGSFNEGDSISISLVQKISEQYIPAGEFTVKEKCNTIEIPISYNSNEVIMAFTISIHKQQEGLTCISSIAMQDIAAISANNLLETIWWQDNTTFTLDSTSSYISGYVYKDRPAVFASNVQPYYLMSQQKYIRIITVVFFIFSIGLLAYSLPKKKEQALLVAVFTFYVMCLPLKISWGNWALIPLAIAILTLFVKNKMRRLCFNAAFYGILGIFLAYLIGATYTSNPNGALSKIVIILTAVSISFLLCTISLKKRTVYSILLFFSRFIALYCVFIITCYLLSISALQIHSVKEIIYNAKVLYLYLFPFPSFYHPSFISIIIVMAIPFAIFLYFEKKTSLIESLLYILPIVTAIIFSGARIGLVLIFLLMVLCILFYLKIKLHIKYSITALITIGLAVLFYFPFGNVALSDPLRNDQRETAITAIKEKPFFGWGTDSMEALLHDKAIAQKAGLEKPVGELNHFHNQYLDMLVQFGIVGSLPFFALFAYLIYLAIKRKDFLLMAYLAIYLPFMYVESPFATAKGIQPMIFWLCFLLSTQKVRLESTNLTSDEANA